MPDLLLEVLSEEIPARMQAGGAQQLERQVERRMKEDYHVFESTESFATPRRLAVIVRGLWPVQLGVTTERKGPRVDAPEKAIAGFLKSTGLTLEDCEQRETPKGPVWFAVTQEEDRPIGPLLAKMLPQVLATVSWPKSMRWDESGTRWVRPIRSILCLLDDVVVPFSFAGVDSGRTTLGHRFLSPGLLTVDDTSCYEGVLEAAHVMPRSDQRKEKIRREARALTRREKLFLTDNEKLVEENAGLVEWPVVLMGSIDERFTDLPAEVLRSAMDTHQRYFSVRGNAGRLAPRFVMVANTETADDCTAVIAGNERVLRARLADARFFWDQDRRYKLESNVPVLQGVVFHARLGSVAYRVQRIEVLARTLCRWIEDADADLSARAGLLCKADLVTEMVGEFPDLQGVMGSYYAERQSEPERPEVCRAIREHYSPRGPGEPCPTAPISVAVALADKLDTLAGFFAIDERPTGSKDPFALRRAALGVIRLVIENNLRLPLKPALAEALAGYNAWLPKESEDEATHDALLGFFIDRLKVHLREQDYRQDLVNAVFGTGRDDDLVRLWARAYALRRFLDGDDGANLLTAYRRAANILRIEEKKDGTHYEGSADTTLFTEPEEHDLHRCIVAASALATGALAHESFEKAMAVMATLRAPVDAFFDRVTVNCGEPELRQNRLLMLSTIRITLDLVADFSKIEG